MNISFYLYDMIIYNETFLQYASTGGPLYDIALFEPQLIVIDVKTKVKK